MYLENINSIDDLKKLSVEELPILASEIREFLIKSVSETGGHLGSNLGVVDLTIVLHYLFNSPRDALFLMLGIRLIRIRFSQEERIDLTL